jgi:hypothetical protein
VPPVPLGARRRQGLVRPALVGLEERELQVDVHAVRGLELLDRRDEIELLLRELGLPRRLVEVPQRDHVFGGRIPLRDLDVSGDRLLQVAARPRDLGEPRRRRHELGRQLGAATVLGRRGLEPAAVVVQLAELVRGPCTVGLRAGERLRATHGPDRPVDVSLELAGVGDAGVGGQVGPCVHHRLERLERGVVAPQLDLRVADHTVHAAVVGVDVARPFAPVQRSCEVMAGGGQRGHPHHRVEVALGVPVQ